MGCSDNTNEFDNLEVFGYIVYIHCRSFNIVFQTFPLYLLQNCITLIIISTLSVNAQIISLHQSFFFSCSADIHVTKMLTIVHSYHES